MTKKSPLNYLSYSMIYFFYFFSMASFGSMLSVYLSGGGRSSAEISLIVSASGIFSMIVGPLLGILYDRTGCRKKLSLILLVLSALSGVLFAFTQNTILLFLLNGLSASLLGSISPVCEQIASDSPYRYGILRLWGAIGYAAGTQASGLVLEHADPVFLFIMFAVSALLTGAAFHLAGVKDIASTAAKNAKSDIKGMLSLPLILFAVFSFFFSGVTSTGGTYVPILLQELLGSSSLAGTILFAGTLMEIPIIFLSNRFMDKLTCRQLLLINSMLLIMQGMVYSFSGSTLVTCLILILTKSVTTMLAIMVTLKVVMTLTGGKYATAALSIIATIKSIGGVVLTNAAGQLIDTFGIRAMFTVMLLISVSLFVLCLFVRIPENDKKYFEAGLKTV